VTGEWDNGQSGLTDQVVAAVRWRSKGVCEAVWNLSGDPEAGRRCHRDGVDHHHALLRSRGGRLLDALSFPFHIVLLCRPCHDRAHARKDSGVRAFDGLPLIVAGQVRSRHGRIEYVGPVDTFEAVLAAWQTGPGEDDGDA